jgi:hypothetical protein
MLGSAYQAKYGLVHGDTSFAEMTRHLPPPLLVCQPSKDANEVRCEASDGRVLIGSLGGILKCWNIAITERYVIVFSAVAPYSSLVGTNILEELPLSVLAVQQ